MTETISVRVQHKRMTASQWQSSSLILLEGELGVETDTGKVKVGDGRSRWSGLTYLTGPKGDTGDVGPVGPPGKDGTMRFSDLTESQKESLRGPQGKMGQWNLMDGTKDWIGSWSNMSVWGRSGTYQGLAVIKSQRDYYGTFIIVSVEKDKTYTLSCYAKADRVANIINASLYAGNAAQVTDIRNKILASSPDWQQVSLTFTATRNGTIQPRFESTSASITLYLCGFKLEEGDEATPWMPSLNDLQAVAGPSGPAGQPGRDGKDGQQGTPGRDGRDGVNGQSIYVRYSANANGTNMTVAPSVSTEYIGIYQGTSASSRASDYQWVRITGESSDTIRNQRTNQAFKSWIGTKSDYDKLTAKDANTLYTVYEE